MENLLVQDISHFDALIERLAHIKDRYGNNYPIILFEPNIESQEKKLFRDLIQENNEIHFFSELEEAFKFVQSLNISFILIISSEYNEQQVLQSFQSQAYAYNRRMLDFEEKGFLKDLFKGSPESIREPLKAFVFATHLDCATGSNVNEEVEEIMAICDIKEITKEFRQDFMIIWFDPNFNPESKEKLEKELEVEIQEKNIYDDFDALWKRIENYNDVAYHLVLYGKDKAEKVFKKLDDFQNLLGLYIYHTDSQMLNLSQDDRVEVEKTLEELIPKVREGIRTRSKLKNTFPAFATNFDAWDKSHLYNTHYYLKGLIQFRNRKQAKKDFIQLAWEIYQDREKELIRFENTYHEYNKEEILRWYTKDSPIYRLVNNCLRISSSDSILYCRFALQDLERAIREEYRQKSKEFSGLVYRGAYISADEWEKLQRNTSKAIEMYGFLSTSVDKRTALNFVRGDPQNKVLITIIIPPLPTLDDQGFADVSGFSAFKGEKEILFNVRSRFRILETEISKVDARGTKCRHLVLLYGAETLKKYINKQKPQIPIEFELPPVVKCDLCPSQNSLFSFNKGIKSEMLCIDCLRRESVPKNTPLFALDLNKDQNKSVKSLRGQLLPWNSGVSFPYYGYKCYDCEKSGQKKYYRWVALNTEKVIEQCSECFEKNIKTEFDILLSEANPYAFWEESETEWEKVDSEYQTKIGSNLRHVYMFVQRFDLWIKYEKKLMNTWSRRRCREREKLDAYHNLGQASSRSGNHQQALEYSLQAVEMAKNIFGEEDYETAGMYNVLAAIYSDLAEYQHAREYFMKALTIWRHSFGENHSSIAAAYNNIASVHQKLGDYKQALEYFLKSLEIRKAVYGEKDPETAQLYNNVAAASLELGNNQQALAYFTEALEINRAIYGEKHPAIALSYNNLGSVFEKLGKYQKALEHFHKALDIGRAVFGDKHSTLLLALSNIASIYQILAKYPQAIEFYKKALDIQKVVYEEKHPVTAKLYNGLGNIYNHLGKYQLALKHHQKALEIQIAIYGGNHPDVGASYSNLASVYEILSDYRQALVFQKKAMGINRSIYGEKHAVTGSSYTKLAQIYGILNDNQQALHYNQKALDIQKAIYGEKHLYLIVSYSAIALICDNLGQYQQSLEHYLKALDIQRSILGEQHPETATLYHNIALACGSLGDSQQAFKYHNMSLNIRKSIYGEKHSDTANSYSGLGYLYQTLEKHQEALDYHNKALEIRKTVYPENHAEIGVSYNNLASVFRALKEYAKARTYFIKSLEIKKVAYGENHPSTVTTICNLAEVYQNLGQYQQAIEYYKKTIDVSKIIYGEKFPYMANIYENLASIYKTLGEKQLAESSFKKFLNARKSPASTKNI